MKLKNSPRTLLLFILEIFLFVLAISYLFPIIWIFINSLKTNIGFFDNIWNIPKFIDMQFENYSKALFDSNLANYFINSIFITVIGTILSVMIPANIAYVVAKYDFFGKNFIFKLSIIVFLIPSIGTLGALYKLFVNLGLYDNYLGLSILYSSGFGIGFLIMYSFFKGIAWSYAEAAFIDGADDWKTYFWIMLPLARPGIIALMIISSINIWNDYFTPYIFLQSQNKYTVSVGLYYLMQNQQYSADWVTLFAAVFISTIPMIILYVIFSEKISNNLTTGSIKG